MLLLPAPAILVRSVAAICLVRLTRVSGAVQRRRNATNASHARRASSSPTFVSMELEEGMARLRTFTPAARLSRRDPTNQTNFGPQHSLKRARVNQAGVTRQNTLIDHLPQVQTTLYLAPLRL